MASAQAVKAVEIEMQKSVQRLQNEVANLEQREKALQQKEADHDAKMKQEYAKLEEEKKKLYKEYEDTKAKDQEEFSILRKETLELVAKMKKGAAQCEGKVRLNIGGTIFCTSRETLEHDSPNFFSAITSEAWLKLDDESMLCIYISTQCRGSIY